MEDTTKKTVERVKRTIRRRLKVFEYEKGISLFLKLKKERWDFICELVKKLNESTIYLGRGYTITSRILLPTPSKKVLSITFFISSDGYSVPYPSFDWLESQRRKEPVMVITTFCMLERAKNRYHQFLREKGLAKERFYPLEIVFKLHESEYNLVEYLF
jgi:hypothetical protein